MGNNVSKGMWMFLGGTTRKSTVPINLQKSFHGQTMWETLFDVFPEIDGAQ